MYAGPCECHDRRFTGICISQTPTRCSHHRTGDITIPIRQLLSESQRRQLLEPHFNMGQREIARYYTLSDDDLKRIRRHRRDHNRLGYAVQLALLRYPGWPFRPAEAVPVPMITYIAAQIGVRPKLIKEYSTTRDTTRREHLAQV